MLSTYDNACCSLSNWFILSHSYSDSFELFATTKSIRVFIIIMYFILNCLLYGYIKPKYNTLVILEISSFKKLLYVHKKLTRNYSYL